MRAASCLINDGAQSASASFIVEGKCMYGHDEERRRAPCRLASVSIPARAILRRFQFKALRQHFLAQMAA